MIRAIRVELFKLRRRPSTWVLGLILIGLLLLGYLLIWHFISNPPKGARFGRDFNKAVALQAVYPGSFIRTGFSAVGSLGGALCMLLGVLATGSEYGWGTLKTLLIQGPGRVEVYLGKLIALAVVVLLFVLVMLGVAAAVSAILVQVDGATSAWPDVAEILKGIAAGWLIFGMWASFGVFLAFLLRQAAMAIGIGLVYMLIVEAIIGGLLTGIGGDVFSNIYKVLPGSNTVSLISVFGTGPRFLGGGGLPVVDAQRAVITLAAYVVAFLAIAAFAFTRRDINLGR
jgi:ABC-2 type transport system permease protein